MKRDLRSRQKAHGSGGNFCSGRVNITNMAYKFILNIPRETSTLVHPDLKQAALLPHRQ
jgi:hypothetical protein